MSPPGIGASAHTAARVAEWAQGVRAPQGAAWDAPVRGASIDSRTLEPGALFAPLAGGHTDGHAFLAAAFARGAAVALCARARYPELQGREPGPLVVVDDVTAALQRVAARWRAAWTGTLIGVTGSAGKTTTKDLVALALATRGPVHRTQGNLNNHWGVPLTLVGLLPEHRAAVVEMATNHPGEIAALAALAAPDHAIVTTAGSAHIEHFGSVEAIAREKAALARAVPAGGCVFAGWDAPALRPALAGLAARLVTYGFAPEADLRPTRFEDLGPEGILLEVEGFPPLRLALHGRHVAANALAALAVARHFALDPEAVARALAAWRPSGKRMQLATVRGATVLVDCYNANPEATAGALAALAAWPGARRIAVLGDMLELGPAAAALHERVGKAVANAELWAVGAHADDYARGARAAGVATRTFADPEAAARALEPMLAPGTIVLLKASRGAALERVLTALGAEVD